MNYKDTKFFSRYVVLLCISLAGLRLSASAATFKVRTDIPYGNAANVSIATEDKAQTVRFTAHPHGGPESLWFCFRVQSESLKAPKRTASASSEQNLRLILECTDNLLGGGRPMQFRPVVRYAGGDWRRVSAPEIIQKPDGRRDVCWTVAAPAKWLEFALSYPYGRENLEKMVAETGGFWRADTIGVSQNGRPLIRLSNDYGTPGGKRPGLYLLARQHSGEVSGSWVLDGVLRRIAELGTNAPLVWAVPLANIDGVEQGDYGKDNFPYDLNRAWGQPPMRHEILVLQRDMRLWARRCAPFAGVDFHAPGGTESDGIFAFVKAQLSEETGSAIRKVLGGIQQSLGPEFAADKFARVGNYASRWETPRFGSFCIEDLKVLGITLETPYGVIKEKALSREDYQEAGGRIAGVLVEHAKSEK